MVLYERDGSADHELPRRWYSITASGDVYLKSWVGSLARYGEVTDLFFSVYGGPGVEASSEA